MKISVITVVFNDYKNIESTIRSVISQKYCNFEYIIIDGGSTDGTIDIINKYKNEIDVAVSEPDRGIYDAMNKGISKVTGDWVIFLNSGDLFCDDITLKRCIPYLKNNTDVLYGDTLYRYNGYDVYEHSKPLNKIEHRLPFCHQSVFVKANIIKERLFNINYRVAADYDMFFNFYVEGKIFDHIDLPISIYNLVGGQTFNNPQSYLRETCKINKTTGSFYFYKTLFFLRLRKFVPIYILSFFRKIKKHENFRLHPS